jgi:Rab-like protein 3
MVPRESVRVLVLGDAGVGKTSFVHLLCHGEVAKKTSYTVGAEVDVAVHSMPGKAVFVELVDVGGSSAFEHSRHVWYRAFDGIIGVYDAANANSRNNLDLWFREAVSLANVDVLPWRADPEGLVLDLAVHLDKRLAGRRVPVLIVANKRDLLRGQAPTAAAEGVSVLARSECWSLRRETGCVLVLGGARERSQQRGCSARRKRRC